MNKLLKKFSMNKVWLYLLSFIFVILWRVSPALLKFCNIKDIFVSIKSNKFDWISDDSSELKKFEIFINEEINKFFSEDNKISNIVKFFDFFKLLVILVFKLIGL